MSLTFGQFFAILAIILVVAIIAGLVTILIITYSRESLVGKGVGTVCKVTTDCQVGLGCDDGICRPQTGTRCKGDSDCAGSDVCVDHVCAVDTGETPKAVIAPKKKSSAASARKNLRLKLRS